MSDEMRQAFETYCARLPEDVSPGALSGDDLYGVIDRAMQRSWTDTAEYEYAPSEITVAVRTWMDEQCFRRGAPAESAETELFPGEQEPIATNPILRGVDLALDRLVRQDCFTDRTLRILDDLRAEVIGVRTADELREHYRALSTGRGSDE